MKATTKARIRARVIEEARFFVFQEKEPLRGVFNSPTWLIALFTGMLVGAFYLAFIALELLQRVGALGMAGLYVALIFGLLEPPHYWFEHPRRRGVRMASDEIKEHEYAQKQGSGRDSAEALIGR